MFEFLSDTTIGGPKAADGIFHCGCSSGNGRFYRGRPHFLEEAPSLFDILGSRIPAFGFSQVFGLPRLFGACAVWRAGCLSLL